MSLGFLIRNDRVAGLADVRTRESTVKIVVKKGPGRGEEFRLLDGNNMLGRDVTNRIRLLDSKVSRKHCKIRKIGQSLFVYDLTTKNGTLVNGEAVNERELSLGDEIKVGGTILKIVEEGYVAEEGVGRSSPVTFFRRLTMAVLGRRQKGPEQAADYEFTKFERKSSRQFWRLPVDTDPPEGRDETLVSHSNPE